MCRAALNAVRACGQLAALRGGLGLSIGVSRILITPLAFSHGLGAPAARRGAEIQTRVAVHWTHDLNQLFLQVANGIDALLGKRVPLQDGYSVELVKYDPSIRGEVGGWGCNIKGAAPPR